MRSARSVRRVTREGARRRARRGSALILVLMMTLAIAGLAVAAIFMSSSAGLLSAFYDRERSFRYAAEGALEMVRSRLMQDTAFAIPDTGYRQVISGLQARDASGGAISGVNVNVYAATTGDTTGSEVPTVTLIALAYDARGTRHVRRMDLRRESFSRYAILVDSFPAGLTHGPGTVHGRVHSNTWWRSLTGSTYTDTVTTVAGVDGVGTYVIDSVVGARRIAYPRDSTFPRLDTLANAAGLSFAPVSGSGRGSRLEFVVVDADADGVLETQETFVKVFDLATGMDTLRLTASPSDLTAYDGSLFSGSVRYLSWDNPIVQNQCGAFYYRRSRWHFFPVSSHRVPYVATVLTGSVGGHYPPVSAGHMGQMNNYSLAAARAILEQPTARCFPAGSPYLMPAERKTNAAGVVTGGATDLYPFGYYTPVGGWPASTPAGYGGSDTTFTPRSRTCWIRTSGLCDTPAVDLGSWRAFSGTAVAIPVAVRDTSERRFLWPLGSTYNASSRGVVSATSGPLFVSGAIRGSVTLRVNGRVGIVDRLGYAREPDDAAATVCEDRLGVLATGDVLVVDGLTSRVRLIGEAHTVVIWQVLSNANRMNLGGGAEPRFAIGASLMSTAGTVGVEDPGTTMGATSAQWRCPEGGLVSTASNGGCLIHTGAAVMRRYTPLFSGTSTGFRYGAKPDPCQATRRRPPFFPLTNRYTFVRTLEIEPSQANTPAKVRALLMRLKGKAL